MIIAFLLAFSFYSSSSMAFPQEGDHARYLAHYKGRVYEMKKSLIYYDAQRNSFIQATKLSVDEVILKETVNELGFSWFYTPAKIENVLKTCIRREGMLEMMTIGHKKAQVCTFHNEDAQMDYSIGMVPFGQVRFQEYLGNGEFLDFHLVDFN